MRDTRRVVRADISQRQHRAVIEELAARSNCPIALVEKVYRRELARLEADARITRYLPLLASHRVRTLLRDTRAHQARHCIDGRDTTGSAGRGEIEQIDTCSYAYEDHAAWND